MKACLFTLMISAALSIQVPARAASTKQPEAVEPPSQGEVIRHDLRGIVTAVDSERSTLMVKHDEIPGVMRAMTMRFIVDPTVTREIKVGQTITAKMSRIGIEWRLEDVRVIPARSK